MWYAFDTCWSNEPRHCLVSFKYLRERTFECHLVEREREGGGGGGSLGLCSNIYGPVFFKFGTNIDCTLHFYTSLNGLYNHLHLHLHDISKTCMLILSKFLNQFGWNLACWHGMLVSWSSYFCCCCCCFGVLFCFHMIDFLKARTLPRWIRKEYPEQRLVFRRAWIDFFQTLNSDKHN